MIPKECKRLAEVDFPIAVVSKHSAREKSIRHGHPSTLHLWWARRPLAACRAMLLALLWPDPCDPNCPREFKEKARELLAPLPGKVGKSDEDLRKALLRFIGDFADWDRSNDPVYLEVSRTLVKAAHGDEPPLVVDPFAGGGSIPLEALRVGCDAFASDLNPVACLILKVMLEDIPRHGPELAEKLRKVGAEIKAAAEKELKEFYPDDEDGAKPIAYLWARTVRCEASNCGAEIPLMRSFWLSKKEGRKRALKYKIMRQSGKTPFIEFDIFEPKLDKEIPPGTVARAKATCLCCNTVLPPERVRAQLTAQKGGADIIFDEHGKRIGGARLLVVVTLHPSEQRRKYRLPTEKDYRASWKAQKHLRSMLVEWEHNEKNSFYPVPDEPLPRRNTLGLRVPNYGVRCWSDLFSDRQNVVLATLAKYINGRISDTNILLPALALAVSRTADYCSANCSLHAGRDVVRNTWARNALPIVWDFYESNVLGDGSGNFSGAIEWIAKVLENTLISTKGSVESANACDHPLPDDSVSVWFTDPPYYDAIGYSESSDFFFVWLKRVLCHNSTDLKISGFVNQLTPKNEEIIQDDTFQEVFGIRKDAKFFEDHMASAFREGRRLICEDGISSIVFAHKTTEGWEALLSAIMKAGWIVTGSWPIQTEMENKVSGSQSGEKKAMLMASVHLVCRPRPEDAPVGDWGDVLRELPQRVGNWMERLQKEHIRGADLVFACIGPALEIYSRYSKVVDPEEREIPLGGDPEASEPYKRGFLAYVWEVVGRTALENILGSAEATARNGMAGALEEDARLTALFLWTLQSTNGEGENGKKVKVKGKKLEIEEESEGHIEDDEDDEEGSSKAKTKGFSLIYDVARRFAQPLGIHLPEWEGRIIETKKGVVRLLSVSERAEQLFGKEGTRSVAERIERSPDATVQMMLFPEYEETLAPRVRGRRKTSTERLSISLSEDTLSSRREATTLDRVHAAMLLQTSGQPNALRALLKSEHERGTDFLRLANALSALYPKTSEEKRLLDAMLLAYPK